MQIIYHWHSFVEIVTDEKRIVIDPFVEGNPSCDVTVEHLLEKQIDAVIVTHGHDDHIWCTAQISQKYSCPIITSYELAKYFERELWLEHVSPHGIGGYVAYEWFGVKLFQARHGWGVSTMQGTTAWYTTVAAWVIVTIDDRTIYHAWDTGLFWDMKMLDELYDVDVACLPIGDRYTMWLDDAVVATSWIKPKYVFPIHFNTRPKISADGIEFARRVLLDGHAVPKVLRPGQGIVM